MTYFIGLTFHQNYLQFKKIASFRKRFDCKFEKARMLQMTLLPPFQLKQGIENLSLELEEELDGHLLGLDEIGEIKFDGMDIRYGRTSVIYLRPSVPIDLFHCQENMFDVIKENGGHFKKQKASNPDLGDGLSTFLPIGRFMTAGLFEAAIDVAKLEFSSPFSLQAKDITLFEKLPGQWVPRKTLFTFPQIPQHGVEGHNDFTRMVQYNLMES